MTLFLVQRYKSARKVFFSPGLSSPQIVSRWYSRLLKNVFLGITVIYVVFVLLKYGFILVGAFTEHWGYDYSLTLRHFQKVLEKDLSPFINSVALAFFSAGGASLFGVFLSYLIKRKNFRFRRITDLAATLPAAVPGILLGIGYLVTFKYPLLGAGRFYLTGFPPDYFAGYGDHYLSDLYLPVYECWPAVRIRCPGAYQS